jgi:hypothetical protein
MSKRPTLAPVVVLLFAALTVAPRAAAEEPKTDYRIYLLARDPVNPIAITDRADPSAGIVGDLKSQLEALGAKVEKTGSFDTPTLTGGARGNDVVVYTASWTKADYDKAAALGRGVDLVQVRIEPAAAAAAPRNGKRAVVAPSEAADLVAARVNQQLGFEVPKALLQGDGLPFDGGTRADGSITRDAVAEDYSRAASRLGVSVAALPKDAAQLQKLLTAAPARKTAAPPPLPSTVTNASIAESVGAAKGVDPEILRALQFASQSYMGGFGRSSGLHGPMGLSMAAGRDYGLNAKTIDDPQANIAAGADHFNALMKMFGGNLSRSVAAYYCGSGAVRQSRGIPADCAGFVSQFYLSYQNGSSWALDHNAPRRQRPVIPPDAVSPLAATGRAAREDGAALIQGDTSPNRSWHSQRMPAELLDEVTRAATSGQNSFDKSVSVDPAIFTGLVWAEGGYSPGNKRPNVWGAVGPVQVTYSGAAPHCKETNAQGQTVFDWKAISNWQSPKNVECGAKVFYDHIQETQTKDPIIGLALYNTQARWWPEIIRTNKVPAFPETVNYVTRAAIVACSQNGKMILTPDHFKSNALGLARKAEKSMIGELASEGNSFNPACRVFPQGK